MSEEGKAHGLKEIQPEKKTSPKDWEQKTIDGHDHIDHKHCDGCFCECIAF
jgi:hypothetical protein